MSYTGIRIGVGYDVHQLVKNQKLIIGGVEFQHPFGLLGYSDADVLIHAIADAILGALAEGDLGKHFPTGEPEFKDMSGAELLTRVSTLMFEKGFCIVNVDSTVIMQSPKISDNVHRMRENISSILKTKLENVSVKATTTDKLGFTGRQEGVAAEAVVLLQAH